MADKAILYDSTKCTACRGCQVACKQWWGLEADKTEFWGTYENPRDLTADTWIKIRFNEISNGNGGVDWIFTRQSCMHCTDAACVKVCPTKALYYHPLGFVAYDKDLCSGFVPSMCLVLKVTILQAYVKLTSAVSALIESPMIWSHPA